VGLERQPIDGRFRTSGDAVDGARLDARFDEPALFGRPVEQHLALSRESAATIP